MSAPVTRIRDFISDILRARPGQKPSNVVKIPKLPDPPAKELVLSRNELFRVLRNSFPGREFEIVRINNRMSQIELRDSPDGWCMRVTPTVELKHLYEEKL